MLASPERLLALDARVVVHDKDVPESKLSHSAIRPYPARYVWEWTMKDGSQGHHPPHPSRGRAADDRVP